MKRKLLDLKAAKQVSYRLLKCRSRSEKEIGDWLKLKGFTPEITHQAVEHLYKLRYLNDREFAKAWVLSRLNRALGLRRIILELRQKGIGQDLINEVLAEIKPGYNEHAAARDLVRARFKGLKKIEYDKARRRIFSLLIRRGFSLDVANEVVEDLR